MDLTTFMMLLCFDYMKKRVWQYKTKAKKKKKGFMHKVTK